MIPARHRLCVRLLLLCLTWPCLYRVLGADTSRSQPPNIVLLLADDLGYSDLDCYGGEIPTPNLDRLAAGGLRFTQFYNTARCWPSRAAILTGYYAQEVRRDIVPGATSGGAGTRPSWAQLLPARLRERGYRSYHSGKWHLDGRPLDNGFDHSYSLDDHDRHFAPQLHREDDKPLPAVTPGSGYYTTTAIATHAIRSLEAHAREHAEAPFFSYIAFTAPHFPLQAPAEDIQRQRQKYDAGWEVVHEARWRRQQQLGIGGSRLAPFEREVGPPYPFPEALQRLGSAEVNRPVPWSTLTSSQQRFQSDKMAVHAAMVDRMDREIGRILNQLQAMGAWTNTLILFLSDNGASAEIMVRGDGHNPDAQCGTGATFLSLGPGWSTVANTPFRRHKTWVHEGGISTPFIAHWPAGIRARNTWRHGPSHVIDIAPTCLELAGIEVGSVATSPDAPKLPGRSLRPLFQRDLRDRERTLWWWHEENRALRVGDWKIVAAGKNAPWELYNLRRDRSETQDLAGRDSGRVARMAADWQRMTDQIVAHATQDLAKPTPVAPGR